MKRLALALALFFRQRRRRRLLEQPVVEQPAVGQAGQGVVEGQALDFIFQALELSDVLDRGK